MQWEAKRRWLREEKESGGKAAWFGFNEQIPAEYRRIRINELFSRVHLDGRTYYYYHSEAIFLFVDFCPSILQGVTHVIILENRFCRNCTHGDMVCVAQVTTWNNPTSGSVSTVDVAFDFFLADFRQIIVFAAQDINFYPAEQAIRPIFLRKNSRFHARSRSAYIIQEHSHSLVQSEFECLPTFLQTLITYVAHPLMSKNLLVFALISSALNLIVARLHSLPEDPHAFPKFKVTFLNNLPVLNETAQKWLSQGIPGGELEFLNQPWEHATEEVLLSLGLKEIDGGFGESGSSSVRDCIVKHTHSSISFSYSRCCPKVISPILLNKWRWVHGTLICVLFPDLLNFLHLHQMLIQMKKSLQRAAGLSYNLFLERVFMCVDSLFNQICSCLIR